MKLKIKSILLPMAFAAAMPTAFAETKDTFGNETDQEDDVSSLVYIGGGVMFTRSNSPKKFSRNLGGVTLGGGVVLSGKHYVGMDLGVFVNEQTTRYYIPWSYYDDKSELVIVPVHLTYNYFCQLNENVRFRIGPSIGVTVARNDETSPWRTTMITTASLSAGGDLGFSVQLSDHVYLDAGYRVMAFRSAREYAYDGKDYMETFIGHQFLLSVGARF